MDTRLAQQFALVMAVVVVGQSLLGGHAVGETIENALLWGSFGWVVGAVVAVVITRLAREHVATLAGQAAEAAEADEKSQGRVLAAKASN